MSLNDMSHNDAEKGAIEKSSLGQGNSLAQEKEQLSKLRSRISEHQQIVADKERANQLKAQDLIQREQRLAENEALLKREQGLFREQHQTRTQIQSKRGSLVAPILLIACVAAGYFAFENINDQRQYFKQVKAASANVDRLSRVLGITQQKMVKASSELDKKRIELEHAKQLVMSMLENTKNIEIKEQVTSSEQGLLETLLLQSKAPENYVEPRSKPTPKVSYEKLFAQLNNAGSVSAIDPTQQTDELQGIKRTLTENATQLEDSIGGLAEREKLIENLKQNVAALSQELASLKQSYSVLQSESQPQEALFEDQEAAQEAESSQ